MRVCGRWLAFSSMCSVRNKKRNAFQPEQEWLGKIYGQNEVWAQPKKQLGSEWPIEIEGIMYEQHRNGPTTAQGHRRGPFEHKWERTGQGQIEKWTSTASKKRGKVWVNPEDLDGQGRRHAEWGCWCSVWSCRQIQMRTPRVFWVLISWGPIWKESHASRALQTILSSIEVSIEDRRLWGLNPDFYYLRLHLLFHKCFMPEIPTTSCLY